MQELMPMLEQFRTLLFQAAPVDGWGKTVTMLGVLLLIGVGISVFGAKLARFAVAGACGMVGASFGAAMAKETGLAVPPCAVVAGAMLAVVGYLTFRLWVGVMTAGVLALLAISIFGHEKLNTHLAEFRQTEAAQVQVAAPVLPDTASASLTAASGDGLVLIPDALPAAPATVERFWSYLKERDAQLATDTKGVAAAAALGGLFLGVVLVRVMLIVSTSLAGTLLVVLAALGIIASVFPNLLASLQTNPSLAAVGMGGILLTSLLVQTLLTRGGERAAEPSAKS